MEKKPPSSGSRQVHTKVKTAKGRKISSTRWLQRQLNDPYVTKAHAEGYRSRAAYKIIEMDDKFHFLKKGHKVVDLGAAPGGWTQVAVQRVQAGKPKGGTVVGIDLLEIPAIPHAILTQQDFLTEAACQFLKQAFAGNADVVMSDMAAASCGHAQTDHLRIVALCEAAFDFAIDILAPGGVFIAKILRGGTETELLARIKTHFTTVKHVKPAASRADSTEMYIIATGFKSLRTI